VPTYPLHDLYDQGALDAAVAAERERCAAWLEIEGRHDMAYGVRHAMHEGALQSKVGPNVRANRPTRAAQE
jgi:hypothetical protein